MKRFLAAFAFLTAIISANIAAVGPIGPASAAPTVANINLVNAITAFSRTSSSGVTPMTWSVSFGANVHEGDYLRAQVFSDSGLSTVTQTVVHLLTHADLQSGATINLTADGLTAPAATEWLQLTVFTTSPNGTGYSFSSAAISPTDVVASTTWNPSDKAASVVITNTNLTAQNTSGSYAGVRSTSGKSTGKLYFEVSIQDATTLTQVGVANATASLTNFLGSDTNSVGYFSNSGGAFFNGAQQSSGNSYTTGNVIGVAIDIPNHLIWFAVNNVWFNAGASANPATGVGGMSIGSIGTVFPAFNAKSGQGTLKPTSASQTYTAPTGFTPWG